MRVRSLGQALLGLSLLAVGCSDDTVTIAKKDVAVTVNKEASVKTPDAALKDAPKKVVDKGLDPDLIPIPDKRLWDLNLPLCKDTAALRTDALTNGDKVFKGLTSTTASTPIAEVLNNMSKYRGKVVRIEGVIVEVCPYAGCYVRLNDGSGKEMVLKVEDGTYDFRLTTQAGNYAIGEGLPEPTGDHGPQVVIQQYGAMLGNIICPVPTSP